MCRVQHASLDDSQARIKTAGRNINLRYADDTTQMAECKEDLKSLLKRVQEETKKAGLKLTSWHLIPSLHSKQMGKSGNSGRLYFLELPNHCGW